VRSPDTPHRPRSSSPEGPPGAVAEAPPRYDAAMKGRARTVIRRNLERALREGRLEEAEQLLARLRREAPLELPTRGLELEYLLAAGRLEEAWTLAERLITAHPTSARIFFLAGRVAYARRDYPRALELFREAGRLSPHWKIRYWTGKTLTQAGRLDEAEPILREVVEERPFTVPALAWLHERRGELEEAIRLLEAHCAAHPDDRYALEQMERLRARSLDPHRLQQEVETLLELGEEVPPQLLAEHAEALLRTGQGPQVRELVASARTRLDPQTSLRIAWACHRFGLPDLAYSLFLECLPTRTGDHKLLSALEKDARLAGRTEELAESYRELAPREPRLWGRLRRLQASLARHSPDTR